MEAIPELRSQWRAAVSSMEPSTAATAQELVINGWQPEGLERRKENIFW